MCYHVKFGHSPLKDVCINSRKPPKMGRKGSVTARNTLLPHVLPHRIWSFYIQVKHYKRY